jgi:ABC-type uncharacterized transport system YnjBCD ATPase subunit
MTDEQRNQFSVLRLSHTGPWADAQALQQRVRQARSVVERRAGEAAAVARAGIRAREEAEAHKAQAELLQQAASLLTSVGEERQARAQEQVEGLVTQALRAVFGDGISFAMVQGVKGNQPVVEFVVRSDYGGGQLVETDVLAARGGGMAAVIGFALRLVILLLTPEARRVLLLDESFGMVSRSYETAVAEFLREVADRAGVQIVLVTHSDAFDDLADKRYQFALGADGATEVREL